MKTKSRVMTQCSSFAIFLVALLFAVAAWAGNPKMATLYNFTGLSDGGTPVGALAFDSSGNLYGTGESGGFGSSCGQGGYCGVVFELLPSQAGTWKERVLYDEDYSSGPKGSVVFDRLGNLYSASGTQLYEMSPPRGKGAWTVSDIYSSSSVYGTLAEPIVEGRGNLYTTSSAGPGTGTGSGYVSQLVPPTEKGGTWIANTLYAFTGGTDGGGPFGLVVDRAGNLYGAASYGGTGTGCIDGSTCGVVYELTPQTGATWQESVLYNFQASDGAGPYAPLIFDSKGNLYGVISSGGGVNSNCPFDGGCGLVFELSPPAVSGGSWTETVIHRFQGGQQDGSNAMAGLAIDPSGNLYGTTEFGGTGFCLYGGTTVGCGTIFELSPSSGDSWTETILHNFQGGSDGAFPLENLILNKAGVLFGTTSNGGSYGKGSVFEVIP